MLIILIHMTTLSFTLFLPLYHNPLELLGLLSTFELKLHHLQLSFPLLFFVLLVAD